MAPPIGFSSSSVTAPPIGLLYKGAIFLFLSHTPPIGLSSFPYPKHHPAEKMQYHGPTFRRLRTTSEQQYPPGTIVETTVRVWAQSMWRGPVDLAHDFLADGFAHLPWGSPVMYHLNEFRDGVALKLLTVTFTNLFNAYELLGEVFWCGCESNFFTNFTSIFPTRNHMHCLPYDK
jgi:hypothetical protein